MQTATDRSKTDCTHRKIVKNNLIGKMKKLQEENDKIDRILRSSAYTEAGMERKFHQRERNVKEIMKLNDEINKIDNELFSPAGNNPATRGRSQTRGPNIRNASPSPVKRSPRSASSSLPRRRSDQTDEDKLRLMQDQLEQSRKENELLRRECYAESLGYGEEMNWLRSKSQDMDSDVCYRLRVQNADLSMHHKKLFKENVDLRYINYKLCIDSELMSKDIKELATKLQNQNIEVTRYMLDYAELEHDNDLLRNENERFTLERKSLYEQIEELSSRLRDIDKNERRSKQLKEENDKELNRLRQLEINYKSEAEVLRSNQTDLENKVQHLEAEKETLQLNGETERRATEELRRVLYAEKRNSNELRDRIKDIERLRQLEINYKSEAEVLRSNQTDLENKVQHLEAEKERLQLNGETERRATEELRRVLYAEKRNSNELRDKIKDIERFKEQEIQYKSETEVLRSNHTDLEKNVQHLQAETKRLQRNGEMERKEAEELRSELNSEKGKSDELCDRIKDLERILRIEEKGREQLKQDIGKELNRLRQLEINYKIEQETLRSNHTDLEKKVKQLQVEKERLLQNEQSERQVAENLKRELDAEKRNSNKIRDRMRDLERESFLSIEKLETGRKQILDEKDRELIRLRRLENDYKIKTDILKHELADLRKDFELLQEEKDELIHSKKTEMKKTKDVQKELDDARREEATFRDKIKELEKCMMTVPKVDPSMSEENSRLKEDLKHIGIELQNAQKRLTQLDLNNKIEAASHTSNQTALEKKVKRLQDEKEKLLQNEEMKRKLAEKRKSESGDRDLERERFQHLEKLETKRKQESVEKERELIRLRRSENDYKNKTDILKHELADLRKDFALLQEEKDELIHSKKTEMKKAKYVQKQLDDARREEAKFRDKIKELEKHMVTVPKVDPSMSEENSRLKEDLKHIGIELQNAQERQMNTFPKVDSSMAEENSGLKEDLKHLGIELQKAQQNYKKKEESLVKNVNRLRKENDGLVQNGNREREEAEKLKTELDATKTDLKKFQDRIRDLERKGATSGDKKDESDSLTLTLSEAVKEFQGIFKKEWKEAARALSNNRVLESQIWQKLYEILKICLCGTNTECTDMTKSLKRFRYFKSDHNLQKETVMKMACVATAVPTKTKEILEMISTGNHHVPNSAPDAVKTSPSKDEEHEKYSDIEGSVIRIVDKQDTESGNPSATVGTSPIGMARSFTNYDLTSDFSKSFSIEAQKE